METIIDVAGDVMPFALAAIGAYGTSVLAKTSESAADTPVALGTRVLQRVFGRGDAYARGLIERVADAKPDDGPSQDALRSAIVAAFTDEPGLAREVAAMLPRARVGAVGGA
ncbi:hypothetical protein [Nonomuraea sp. NPDC050783]|uniref:hypothetical protein n=1 Tax=Nonomuraea sp. NPDC050783 TaxID=3154634 RepID=UPI0034657339